MRSAAAPAGLDTAAFRATAAAALTVALVAVAVSGTDLLGDDVSQVTDTLGRLTAAAFATAAAAWSARQARAGDVTWRRAVAAGTGGWTLGLLVWTGFQLAEGHDVPTPTPADIGFLALPLFLLPALWTFPARSMPEARTDPHDDETPHRGPLRGAIFAVDSLVVVGSIFLLAWSAALGAAFETRGPSLWAFLVALAHPLGDLLVVVLVVLLGTFRDPANPRALLLLGLGLVAITASDSVLLYAVSTDAATLPPGAGAGFVVGLTLLGLSQLVPPPAGRERRADAARRAERRAVLLPYLPLMLTGVLFVVQVVTRAGIDAVEAVLGLALIVLVVGRQLVTLLDNVRLLHRVRDGQDRLRRQAFNDSLTDLANRALFRDRLTHALDLHRRDGRPFALMFCDLDDFKLVNDRHGHAAGDELLQAVADRLRGCVRAADTVARLGGDEFAILLESGAEAPEVVGRRVLAELERPFPIGAGPRGRGVPVRLGGSVGLVLMDPDEEGVTPDVLLARVDTAMYTAKRGGKSRLVTYGGAGGGDSDERDPTEYLGELRAALSIGPDATPERVREMRPRAGAVEVMYQPIVHVATGGVIALEALVRWRHPRLGVVPTGWLLETAAAGSLLALLEDHVLSVACRDIRTVRETPGLGGLSVHVNVSATRTTGARLFAAVQDALDQHDLPGSALVLEITETGRVADVAGASDVLEQIRGLGVRLALDDFGAGVSGLNYLQDLPVDIVKLDRAITTAEVGTRGAAIRTAVVGLARDLGIDLIAEGVESQAQAMQLEKLRCDYAQGYLYSRPRFLADLRFAKATAPLAAVPDPADDEDDWRVG
jgi:diguanylate cyclase (GGDEF)-like protein